MFSLRMARFSLRLLSAFLVTHPVLTGTPAMAQQPVTEDILESLAREEGDNPDFSDLQEHLDYLTENPVNINNAGPGELADLLLLNDFQISTLLEYRKQTGPFLSLYELTLVYGFDRKTVEQIAPFITLGNETDNNYHAGNRQEIIWRNTRRMETAKGFISPDDSVSASPAYPGGRSGMLFRYTGSIAPAISAGLIIQHDPGEPVALTNTQAGFDYLSGYLEYKNRSSPVRKVIAGSYHLRFGQGLVLWSGFSMNKTPEVLAVRKNGTGIRPYRSSDENDAFRGVAATVTAGNFLFFPFFSSRLIDARIISDTAGTLSSECISSLPVTGLHRTESERQTRRTARETAGGMHAGWTSGKLQTGLTLLYARYEYPLCCKNEPYRLFSGRGNITLNTGIDYTWRGKTLVLSGESAYSHPGELAGVQNLQWYLSPLAAFSAVIRYYQPGYSGTFANGFSESGKTRNESGIYAGILLKPLSYLSLSGYMDFFRFPWLTYSSDAPSAGNSFLLTANYHPGDLFMLMVRYTRKEKEKSYLPAGIHIRQQSTGRQQHLRLQGSYPVSPSLQLTTRLDFTRYRFPGKSTDGFLSYQQIRYIHPSLPLKIDFRYLLFSIPGYGARIYTYENDLLYSFSTPVFSGKGTRMFLLIRFSPWKNTHLGIKVSRTDYSDRKTTGQGNDLIAAPHMTDVKMQVRMTF